MEERFMVSQSSIPILYSPLLFPLLSFSEESCDGSLIRINGYLSSFFLVFLPVFYIKKIPQIILTVEGNWRYHVVNCRADQYNNLIWTHSHFSNEKWNKHLFFFLIPSFAPAPPRSNLPFFWKQAKVYSWQQALVIKSFHWLISPYSSCTQARQARTDSPNDQRHSLSGGSNTLCTCGTVTQRHAHTIIPVGQSFSLCLTHTQAFALIKSCTCGRFPGVSNSWGAVPHIHTEGKRDPFL